MSQNSQDAIDVLSKVIVDTIDKKLDTANFDKSQTGVVTAVNGNTYTIAVFGSQYNITSDQIFTVGQSVVVTALQGDMKRLVCSPDNIGTMKTVDSKVNVVGDQLSTFIDGDFSNTLKQIDKIKGQVDESFMSWFYDGAPTLENVPAKDWTTEDAERLHVGDLYYDTTSGYSYEWAVNDGVYSWNKITDSGIQEALKNASKAQDTADGKRRVFYDTPSTPYDRGDMWAQGGAGDLLICNVARTITDSYHQTDWIPASKYTDDTKANEALDSANKANTDLAEFKVEYDSDLKVTKEQIESRVTKVAYTEDLDGLKTRIGTAESRITQTENDITLKVEKNDYTGDKLISMINVQPESVKIKAKNIELTGAVTIQNGKTVIDSNTINNSITQIDGSKITTGTIDARRLNLSGDITMGSDGKIVIGNNVITANNIASGQIVRKIWQNATAGTYKGSNGVVLPFQMSTFPAQLIELNTSDVSQIQIIFKGNRFQSGRDDNENCFSFSSMMVPLFNYYDASAGSDNAVFYTASVPLPSAQYRAKDDKLWIPSSSPVFSFRPFDVFYYNDSSYGKPFLSIYFYDAAIQEQDGSISYGTFSGVSYNDWCIPYRIYGIK